MNPPKKLTSQQRAEEQQTTAHQQHAESTSEVTFNSVEEMLRHDAAQTPVPPGIESRLQESLERTPHSKSWWRRWFGS